MGSILKKGILSTLLFFMMTTSQLWATHGVEMDVVIIPRASYFIHELYEILVEKKSLDEIARIDITNSSEVDLELKLRVQVFSRLVGENRPLIDYTTNYNNFPIDVPTGGSLSITNNDIDEEKLTGGLVRVDEDEVEQRIKDTYGADFMLKTAGMFPEDTYIYKLYLCDKDANECNSANNIETAEESIYVPLEFGNIDIIYPDNGAIIPATNPYPSFYWTPLNVRQDVDVYYQISIWKTNLMDIESVIQTTPIAREVLEPGQTQYEYPSRAEPLEINQHYVWGVEAVDEMGYKIGLISASEIFMFKYGDVIAPYLEDEFLEVAQFPIQLSWRSESVNTQFRVVISKEPDLSSILYDFSSSSPFLQITEPELIEPGITYYWAVFVEGSNADTDIKSKIGKFILKQDISVVFPREETLPPGSINLYWNGSPERSYLVKIDTDSNFSNPKTFKVNGNALHVSEDMLELSPGKRYYWTVLGTNRRNDMWGIPSDKGFFQIEALDKPDIIYPISAVFSETKQTFIFKPVNWADEYELQIRQKKNQKIVFETSIKQSSLTLELNDMPNIDPGQSYEWQVIAKNERYSEVSDVGTFSWVQFSHINFMSVPEFIQSSDKLKWVPVKSAKKYIIHISQTSDFSDAKTTELRQSEVVVKELDLTDTSYIKVDAFDKYNRHIGHSDIQRIKTGDIDTLTDDIELLLPRGNLPLDKTITFKWVPPLKEGTLLISTFRQLTSPIEIPIIDNAIQTAQILETLELNTTYYWGIKQQSEEVDTVASFKLLATELKLLFPQKEELAESTIHFQWVGYKAAQYKVLISNESAFKTALEIETTESHLKYDLEKNGLYFWKVIGLDDNQKKVQDSEVSSFSIKSPVQEISDQSKEELSFFIKQQSESGSVLKNKAWVIETVETKDNEIISDEDIRHLIKHKDNLIRIIEQ